MLDMVIRYKGAQGDTQFAVVFQGTEKWGFLTRESALGTLRYFQDEHFAELFFQNLTRILNRFWRNQQDHMTAQELIEAISDEALRKKFFQNLAEIEDELSQEASEFDDRGTYGQDVTHDFFSGHAPDGHKVHQFGDDEFGWFSYTKLNASGTGVEIKNSISSANPLPFRR